MDILSDFFSKISRNKRLIFVFVISLFILVFFSQRLNVYDAVWNYGFSYGIASGQVLFKDINTVTPGFYAFLMSIGLLFSKNNIMFLIEHAFIITICFYLIYKMFDKSAWLFLFFLCFPAFIAFCPTYNFGLFFLTVIILYLEKNNKNDYLIGSVLGLLLLTKHTVGFFMLLPSVILYIKDWKKLLKRFIGLLIPCFIFLLYLLITSSLYEFFDLCIFGLFDFAKKNSEIIAVYLVLSIIFFVISIIYVIKNKKDILGWYVLCSFSIMLPIFTAYHFYIYLLFMSLLLISKIKINGNYIRSFSLCLTFIIILFNLIPYFNKEMCFLGANNFNYIYLSPEGKEAFLLADKLYDRYRKIAKTTILSTTTVWLNTTNNEKVNYFSVLLTGNYGYNGTDKMIKKIKETGEQYFIVNYKEYEGAIKYNSQFDTEIISYVIDNSKLVEEVDIYKVYCYDGKEMLG